MRCVSTPEVARTDASSVARAQEAVRNAAVEVRASSAPGELRAAAAARALSFYTYPTDRSEFSVRAHRNMRIDAEWAGRAGGGGEGGGASSFTSSATCAHRLGASLTVLLFL